MMKYSESTQASSSQSVVRGAVLTLQAITPGRRPLAQLPPNGGEKSALAQLTPPNHASDKLVAQNDSLISEAYAEARRRGYQDGWAEGHVDGVEIGRQEGEKVGQAQILASATAVIDAATEEAVQAAVGQMSEHLQRETLLRWQQQKVKLDSLIAVLPEQIIQRLDAVQDDMLVLCMDALTHILSEELAHVETVQRALLNAIQRMRSKGLLKIELNAHDLAVLESLPDWPQWAMQHAPESQWVASTRVQTGGCILTSSEGGLDARLEQQLSAFKKLLTASRQRVHQTTGEEQHAEGSGA